MDQRSVQVNTDDSGHILEGYHLILISKAPMDASGGVVIAYLTSVLYSNLETARVIVMSAIDNLMKGQAGQAVQCFNLMMGLEETVGLPNLSYP